jgi:Fe-S cluster biosynthesis and repair protein YggX
MSFIEDMKKGWNLGRDQKIYKKQTKDAWRDYDDTTEALDSELGGGDEERNWRVYEQTAAKPWDDFSAKYPIGVNEEKANLGLLGDLSYNIAKELSRKKKSSKVKPKRKPVKKSVKKVVKKCKCK